MSMRHWRQKFSTSAPLVYRKRVRLDADTWSVPGELVSDEIRTKVGKRLRNWWNAKIIQLAPSHCPDTIRQEHRRKGMEAARIQELKDRAITTGMVATAAVEAADAAPDDEGLAAVRDAAIEIAQAAADAYEPFEPDEGGTGEGEGDKPATADSDDSEPEAAAGSETVETPADQDLSGSTDSEAAPAVEAAPADAAMKPAATPKKKKAAAKKKAAKKRKS